ncbi:MAG: phenylacetate--CoA ligase family protein [Anaerolineae bacterium]|nr:phenylacetate--CoA ligase family protein [Anaerolineae bacterium]
MSNLDKALCEIVAHAYTHAPAFKNMMDDRGMTPDAVQTVADLSKLPVTGKEKLLQMQQKQPPFGGWLAVPMTQLQRIHFSPGMIYNPQAFGDDNGAQVVRDAFKSAGLQSGDIALNTFLYHMVPAGLWLDEGLKLTGMTVIPIGPGNTDRLIDVMMAVQVNTYIGTPSYLERIYTRAGQMDILPDAIPLRKAFFSAEPYLAAQRKKFEGEYGLRTSQAYATADLGLIAYETPGKPGFRLAETMVVEIADPESGQALPDGEVGEVVVTTFNRAFPLIRFGTGDLGITETDDEGERRLKGLVGRTSEAVKVRGTFLHPNQVRSLANTFPQIKHISTVITRESAQDCLKVQIELFEEHLPADQEEFSDYFGAAFKQGAHLEADQIEFVGAGAIQPGAKLVKDERR